MMTLQFVAYRILRASFDGLIKSSLILMRGVYFLYGIKKGEKFFPKRSTKLERLIDFPRFLICLAFLYLLEYRYRLDEEARRRF